MFSSLFNHSYRFKLELVFVVEAFCVVYFFKIPTAGRNCSNRHREQLGNCPAIQSDQLVSVFSSTLNDVLNVSSCV